MVCINEDVNLYGVAKWLWHVRWVFFCNVPIKSGPISIEDKGIVITVGYLWIKDKTFHRVF